MNHDRLHNHIALLSIREAARRRDTFIAGAVFALAFASLFALAMLDRLAGRELGLTVVLTTLFGVSFLMAWVRLEVAKGLLELSSEIYSASAT